MIWYIFSCNWVDTRWQQYSSHLHTNSTPNTKNGTYITITKLNTHNNKNLTNLWSAGRAPSLRVIPWHLPYNWGKSYFNHNSIYYRLTCHDSHAGEFWSWQSWCNSFYWRCSTEGTEMKTRNCQSQHWNTGWEPRTVIPTNVWRRTAVIACLVFVCFSLRLVHGFGLLKTDLGAVKVATFCTVRDLQHLWSLWTVVITFEG